MALAEALDRVRRIALQIMDLGGDEFTEDYSHNKVAMAQYATIGSKQLRNMVAGYITASTRQKNKEKETESGESKVEEPQVEAVPV